MLARLHDAGTDFEPRRPQPQRGFVVQLGLVREAPADAVAQLAGVRPAVSDYLAGQPWQAAVEEAYGALFERLRLVLGELPERPLHGDWQTNNLFFANGEVSGIIDFHQADYAPRLLDLAVAVERNCFFWNRISAGEDGAYDLEHAQALVAAYHAVSPLSAVEREALPDVLAACQFEYGISFLDYYWGVERDREKADWAWDTFVVGHAAWWGSPAGQSAAARIRRWF
jgi:Ser/Thr protein kinase RdoA (MazF antagonist)